MRTSTTATGGADVLSNIPPEVASGVTAASMFAGLFWMNARGLIITRREHEGRIADKNQVIATQAVTIEVKDKQLDRVTIVGETTIKILDSIEKLAREQEKK